MNQDFLKALGDIEKEKGISKDILIEAVENALISAYKKDFSTSAIISVVIDRDTGEIIVLSNKKVVEELTNPAAEIDLKKAREINKKLQVDDFVDIDVTPKSFGRIAAQTAKQVVVQRIREVERGMILREFTSKENDIISGIVQRVEKQNIMIEMGKTEAMLSAKEQVSGEIYKPGERIKLYVVEVKKTTKGPQIILSRSHPGLVKRLFEQEVPEIHNGVVEIKGIAREAGSRTKIAVHSNDENVDPIGACVGQKGNRVLNIADELRGEKIDIIKWNKVPEEYIKSALSPAQVLNVIVNEKEKSCKVIVPDYQLSLAIGKEGQNARLAAKLTGFKIDIKSESQIEQNKELV